MTDQNSRQAIWYPAIEGVDDDASTASGDEDPQLVEYLSQLYSTVSTAVRWFGPRPNTGRGPFKFSDTAGSPGDNHGSETKASSDSWTKLLRIVRQYDESKIEDCKEDMDALLVFAGLFSAIVTAFNVEVYKGLQEDPANVTVHLLLQISQQLAGGVSAASKPVTPGAVSSSSFQIQASTVRVTILWFSSLVFSLITASLAISVKQWLREYMAQDSISPQGYVRVRHFRREGLVKWRVFEIAAILPLLLQCALILFFIGLCDFLHSLHPALGWAITGIVSLWMLIYIATILGPIYSLNCPYKTPFIQGMARWQVILLKYFAEWAVYIFDWMSMTSGRLFGRHDHQQSRPRKPKLPTAHQRSVSRMQQEQSIRVAMDFDVEVLVALDATFIEDDFMETARSCLSDVDGTKVVQCVQRLIEHRIERPVDSLSTLSIDNKILTRNTTIANCYNLSVRMLNDAIIREIHKPRIVDALGNSRMHWPLWMDEAVPWIVRKLDALPAQTLLNTLLSQDTNCTQKTLSVLSRNIVDINNWPLKELSLEISDPASISAMIYAANRQWRGRASNSTQESLSLCLVILLLASHTKADVLKGAQAELRDFFLSLLSHRERSLELALSNLPHSCILASYEQCLELYKKAPDSVPNRLMLRVQRALIRAAGWQGTFRSLKVLDYDKMMQAASIVRHSLNKIHNLD